MREIKNGEKGLTSNAKQFYCPISCIKILWKTFLLRFFSANKKNYESIPTGDTDITAASVELLTGAGAALLLRRGINVDVVWSVLQVLGQHCYARPIDFPRPEDGFLRPVSPEDVLLEDSHSVRVLDPQQDHLSVGAGESGPFDLISKGRGEEESLGNMSAVWGVC